MRFVDTVRLLRLLDHLEYMGFLAKLRKNSPLDMPCGLSARGEGGEEADEVSQLESLGEPPS